MNFLLSELFGAGNRRYFSIYILQRLRYHNLERLYLSTAFKKGGISCQSPYLASFRSILECLSFSLCQLGFEFRFKSIELGLY